MLTEKIYVIHSDSKIESLYTLFPLVISRFNHLLQYVHVDSREAAMAGGRCVILVRVFKGNKVYADDDDRKRSYIENLRKRFDRVIILDDGAGSDSLHFEYMDLVDLYYKGKLLRDRRSYLRPMYGRQIFTDYYHQRFGITDEKEKIREAPGSPELLTKLRVSWNLGCGIYPIPHRTLVSLARGLTRMGLCNLLRPWFFYSYKKMVDTLAKPVDPGRKSNEVQARFGSSSLPATVGHQRNIFLRSCSDSESVLSGGIRAGLYNREMKKVGAVLSPFGWGEVCFRDFEAIMNGCLLIKPDMDHLETWPDIYVNSKTYLPVDWEGANLPEVLRGVVNNIEQYAAIIEGGKNAYRDAFLDLDNRVHHFLAEASGIDALCDEPCVPQPVLLKI